MIYSVHFRSRENFVKQVEAPAFTLTGSGCESSVAEGQRVVLFFDRRSAWRLFPLSRVSSFWNCALSIYWPDIGKIAKNLFVKLRMNRCSFSAWFSIHSFFRNFRRSKITLKSTFFIDMAAKGPSSWLTHFHLNFLSFESFHDFLFSISFCLAFLLRSAAPPGGMDAIDTLI